MNFDGSFPSPVWNTQRFSTDHFTAGCQGPGGCSNARSPAAPWPSPACLATNPLRPTPGHTLPRYAEGTASTSPAPASSHWPPDSLPLSHWVLAPSLREAPPLLLQGPRGMPTPQCCHGNTRSHDVAMQVLPSSASLGLWGNVLVPLGSTCPAATVVGS